METESTLRRFREFWYPDLLDRRRRRRWVEAGATTLGQRSTTRVRETIKEHRPRLLEKDKARRLREILAQAGA